ncbi:LOW QUALITY PROTEIN: hypothetical protein TMHG_03781, partial [Mycobacterium tuberculosis SUMu008]
GRAEQVGRSGIGYRPQCRMLGLRERLHAAGHSNAVAQPAAGLVHARPCPLPAGAVGPERRRRGLMGVPATS